MTKPSRNTSMPLISVGDGPWGGKSWLLAVLVVAVNRNRSAMGEKGPGFILRHTLFPSSGTLVGGLTWLGGRGTTGEPLHVFCYRCALPLQQETERCPKTCRRWFMGCTCSTGFIYALWHLAG